MSSTPAIALRPRRTVASVLSAALVAAAAIVWGGTPAAASQTFVVNSAQDPGDGACDATHCTLREAMAAANATAGTDTIAFALASSDLTIRPLSPLPNVTDAVVVDGWTQPGFSGAPLVELDGSQAGDSNGLSIHAGGTTVRGLVINRFTSTSFNGRGISVSSAHGNVIAGNYIGTDRSGATALPNNTGVAMDFSDNNVIGGTGANARNVISGNRGHGVAFVGSNNRVEGNLIGADASGQAALGNGGTGVSVQGGSSQRPSRDNVIGGATAQAGNVIVANAQGGVGVEGAQATRNTIAHNWVGVTSGAGSVLGNREYGVRVAGESADVYNIVGPANVIAGNTFAAAQVIFDSASDSQITGNSIGTDPAGTVALRGSGAGVLLRGNSSLLTVGGDDGGMPGLRQGAGNRIAFLGTGVAQATTSGTPRGNMFLRNEISDNTGLGIDLSQDGVTPNDADDADSGPNSLQNFPVIATATATDSGTRVAGSLDVRPRDGDWYRLEFYASAACDSSGHGEGARFLGIVRGLTAADSDVSFDAVLPGSTVGGEVVTATASGPFGTSEFSACREVTGSSGGGGTDAVENLTVSASPPSVLPGTTRIPIADIPPESVPLRSIALQATPLRSIDIAASPLRSIPLRSIPLRSIPLRSIPLRSIPLRSIDFPGGWEAFLADTELAGVPVDTLTLFDVVDLAKFQALPLRSIDVAASPLRSISLASIALGATPLRSIPLRSIGDDPLTDWRALLEELGYGHIQIDESTPLLALDIAGVPLRSIPLRSIPLRSIDLDVAPLRSIPLRSIDLTFTPLRSIPLRSIETLVDCAKVDCASGTLADAARAGAIREGVDLGRLLDAVPDHEPALTFGDLLLGLLERADYPWEELPFDELGALEWAPSGAQVTYTVSFRSGASASPTAAVTLPAGFRYVPGSSRVAGAPIADPAQSDATLTWTLPPVGSGQDVTLTFAAQPGLTLGTHDATATVQVNSASDTATGAVTVVEAFEPNDEAKEATRIGTDEVVLSHVGRAGDADFYTFTAEADDRITVHLANLENDSDLVLYSPPATPLRSIPLRSIPLRSIPIEDQGVDVHGAGTAPPETIQDVALAPLPLRSISANRDTEDEQIDVRAGTEGTYTIQVSGYNQTFGASPYALRVKVSKAPAAPACAPRTLAHAGAGTPGTAVTVNPRTDTLVLVNQQRLGDSYGAEAAGDVMDALGRLAREQTLGYRATVVAVDAYPAVRAAYDEWDAQPCSADNANAAVRAVGDVIDAARAFAPDIKHVVLVGADDLLPMARVPDLTRLANEREYAAATGVANPLSGSLASEHVLSDDPYADTDPIPWLNRALYVPDLGVGRLIETPAQIVAAVDQFLAFKGRLDPSTALTTGYDFLTDGADAVGDALEAQGRVTTRLVSDTWTRGDLEDAVLSDGADIAAVNAHFDHHRALPAQGNAAHDESDLFTTAHIDGSSTSLAGRVLFSMGCHGGLSVPDVYIGSTARDWAETFADRGAVYTANTGYGYGDTATVALSERLMEQFAQRLDGTMRIGQALTFAKQEYFAQLGVYGVYDEKVLAEATFYGLPMYRVGPDRAPAAAPAPRQLRTDPATGLPSARVEVTPEFTPRTAPDGSRFLTVGGDVQVTHGRPLQPRTAVDVTQPGTTAHGALITALASSDSTARVTFSRPVVDDSAAEPAVAADGLAFPASLQNVTTYRTTDGQRQRLVLLPGQFRSDDDPTTVPGVGVQRRYTRMEALVYYSDSDDFTPPVITAASAASAGGNTTFTVDAQDAGSVTRVLVLYRDANGWHDVDLALAQGAWRASAPSAGDDVEYLVQVVDAAGNVATTTNKARLFPAAAADPSTLTVTVAAPVAGTYALNEPVSAEYSCTGGSGPVTCEGDVPVGSALHTAEVGSHTFTVVARDASGATAVASVPYRVVYDVSFTAPAGGSGKAKAGSMVTLAWQLRDHARGPVRDLSAVTSVIHATCGASGGAELLGARRNTLRYDSAGEQYELKWKTQRSWPGCHEVRVFLDDGTVHTATMTLT